MWPIIYLGQADSGQSTASVACPFHTWRPRKSTATGKAGLRGRPCGKSDLWHQTLIQSGQATESVSCSRAFVWLFTRVHGWQKTEVNIRHTGRVTCDLKNDPIRAGHRPSGTPPCPVAFYRGIEVEKKRVQHTLWREATPVTPIASTYSRWHR